MGFQKTSVDNEFIKAKSLAKQGKFDRARYVYQSILKNYPKNIRALKALRLLEIKPKTFQNKSLPDEVTKHLTYLFNQNKFELLIKIGSELSQEYENCYFIWNILGISYKQIRNYEVSLQHLKKALILKPDSPEIYNNIGVVLQEKGDFDISINYLKSAIKLNSNYPEAYNNLGLSFKYQNNKQEALSMFKEAIFYKNDYVEAYNNIGILLSEEGDFEEAINFFTKAISIKPNYDLVYLNLGTAFNELGKLENAVYNFEKALSINPDFFECYNQLGNALKKQNKLSEALAAYNKALSINPNYAVALNNIGLVLKDQNKLIEGIQAYKKALHINPRFFECFNNLGHILGLKGEYEKAIEKFNKSLAIQPNSSQAYFNMAIVLKEQGKLQNALECYEKAILINPKYFEAYNNVGSIYNSLNNIEEAINAYSRAISINPIYFEAYSNLGNVYGIRGKWKEAIYAYTKALSIKPNYDTARAQKLHNQAQICDWNGIDLEKKDINKLGLVENFVIPFSLFSFTDNPKTNFLRAKLYSRTLFPNKCLMFTPNFQRKNKKIRIGYFSSDFSEHPVSYLLARVLEKHNRDQFEVYGYSINGNSNDKMRKKLIKSFDFFIDVQHMSDKEVALLARQNQIDIAVNLNGYTQNSRTGIFAFRAAPVQINFLGYPGSMGADYIDYIIGDKVVIPNNSKIFFSEKIIYLPDTYMPTDNTRKISDKFITRKNQGLPQKGFVLCCFNNSYKITSEEFDIWMRLLKKIPKSVLWLRKSNECSVNNFKEEAQKRGVDPTKIIFAERADMEDHLARHKLADLFVDTFNFNAHTTAIDALWSGLPVVTKIGRGFPARVAASLLNSIDLPDLVTETKEEYESLIYNLATNSKKLFLIRDKLAKNCLSKPLFNTEVYTQKLELAYEKAYKLCLEGKKAETINVI